MKSFGKLTLLAIIAASVVGVPLHAVPPPDPKPAAPAAPDTKPKAIPFRGKIGAVDKTAKTITLDEKNKRVFQISSETKMTKDEKPATFDAAAVGDYITGQYTKDENDKLTAKVIKFGMKPPTKSDATAAPAAPTPKKQ